MTILNKYGCAVPWGRARRNETRNGKWNFQLASQLENMKILERWLLIYHRRNGRTSIIITKWLIFTSQLLATIVCLTFFLRKNIVDVRRDSIPRRTIMSSVFERRARCIRCLIEDELSSSYVAGEKFAMKIRENSWIFALSIAKKISDE